MNIQTLQINTDYEYTQYAHTHLLICWCRYCLITNMHTLRIAHPNEYTHTTNKHNVRTHTTNKHRLRIYTICTHAPSDLLMQILLDHEYAHTTVASGPF
jgi:hypothetical protein